MVQAPKGTANCGQICVGTRWLPAASKAVPIDHQHKAQLCILQTIHYSFANRRFAPSWLGLNLMQFGDTKTLMRRDVSDLRHVI